MQSTRQQDFARNIRVVRIVLVDKRTHEVFDIGFELLGKRIRSAAYQLPAAHV